ncbi:MAG: PQQ-binding-like beta-propeller repeat protein [Paracoccaceae bacterium]
MAVWATNVGAGNSRKNRITAAPVVAGGRVFAMDAGAVVSAVSTGGALLWQADLTAGFDKGGGVSGGGLAAQGNRAPATTGYGEVVAMDAASGQMLWRQRVDAPAQGAPAVDGGVVYVTGRDGSAWAIDADNGKVIWQVFGALQGRAGWAAPRRPWATARCISAMPGLDGRLKVGDGTAVWHASAAGSGWPGRCQPHITGDAALVGGTLYTGTGGRTVALEAGLARWSGASPGAMGPSGDRGRGLSGQRRGALMRLTPQRRNGLVGRDALFRGAEGEEAQGGDGALRPALGRRAVGSPDRRQAVGLSPTDGSLVYQTAIPGGAAGPARGGGGVLPCRDRQGAGLWLSAEGLPV